MLVKDAVVIVGLILMWTAVQDVAAKEPRPRQVIVIPAHNGKVLWKDVWREVAAQSGLELPAPLPGGRGIDLNSNSARWTISGLNLLLSPDFELRCDNERDRLLVFVNRETINKPKQLLGEQLRRATSFVDRPARIGLDCKPKGKSAERLVILVHGFGSSTSDLQPLQDRLAAEGYVTGTFGYQSRHGVVEAAKPFSVALRQMQTRYPEARVTIVSHSMGGIVSRWMVEHAEFYPKCVDQLIMIAPPNHGTDWTQPVLTGPPIRWADMQFDPARAGALAGGIVEEFHLAIRDLKPGSTLLTHLNQLDRNPAVSYSIILGEQGAVEPAVFQIPQTALLAYQNHALAAIALNRLLYLQNQMGDEIVKGQGDGVVAISSGLLAGVTDISVIDMKHNDIRRPHKAVFEDLVREVTRRLAAVHSD